ncbi:hypothetical protein [Chitinivibrio alkaliphilus]|uniref:Uracil-DNA glycosylase n=1 Tax=Chitinivibrio alkaliphilus ACht1 TaxID=1313304 RepID=U7DA21_9BACT|nr:hypothetical protein [Chitinivibrio alkaliphilus]ERP31275.1 hypothetical protein CALK_1763 [Chitinivibrio alkaliphilus ACht1]
MNQRVSCVRCSYFYTTWDPHAPRGCRAHGFKSREYPSAVVYRTSGTACVLFLPKQGQRESG